MSKRGRPIKVNAKRNNVRFRLTNDQADILKELSEKSGKSRTDIFVDLITKEHERVVGEE